MRRTQALVATLLLAIVVTYTTTRMRVSLAQTTGWSSPTQLSDTGLFSWFPDVATDPTGAVHVVWATFLPGYDSVMYASADANGAWNRPTDILALPGTGAATRPSITFDQQGNAHIVGRNDNIMLYQRIPWRDLLMPRLWPAGKNMSEYGSAYFSRIAIGPDGVIHFIMTDNTASEACLTCFNIFYRQSRDGGASWTTPMLISPTDNGAIKPQLIVDKSGTLHLVWDAGRGGGLAQVAGNTQVTYQSSRDGGRTWSDPIEFSGPGAGFQDGSGRFITIGEDGSGKLVVVWLKLPDDTPQYQISSDGGLTWSAPTPLPNVFGEWSVVNSRLDTYSMATDSGGNIHLVMVGRLDATSTTLSLLRLTWNGSSWSAPDVIATPQNSTPVWPRIAVGLGNQLHVAWYTADNVFGTEAIDSDFRVWYSRGSSTSPALAPVVLPTPQPSPSPTSTPSALEGLPTPPSVNPNPITIAQGSLRTEVDDYALIAVSVVPALLLFSVVILIAARRRR